MSRKILSFLLASTVVISTQAIASFSAKAESTKVDSLVDLTPSHWAYGAVKMLVQDLGIMSPKSSTRFDGNDQVTRYEAATAFYNLAKKLESVSGKDLKVSGDKRNVNLTDVDAKSKSIVNSVVNEYGLMQAMPGNKFLGNEKLSRYELAFELDNYLKSLIKKVGKVSLAPINRSSALKDIKDDHWATPSVRSVIDSTCQAMSGYTDNTFKGQKFITRYELAALLMKFTTCVDKYLIPLAKATPTPKATPVPTAVPTAKPTPVPTAVPTPEPTPTPVAVPTKKPLSPVDLRLGGAFKVSKTMPANDMGYIYGPLGQLDLRFGAFQIGVDGNYMMLDKKFQDAYKIPGYARLHAGADLGWRILGSESDEDASFVLGAGYGLVNVSGSGYNFMNHGPRGRASIEIPVGSWFSIFAEDRFLYPLSENKAFVRNYTWMNDAYAGITIPASTGFAVQLGYTDTRYQIKGENPMYGDIGGLLNLRFRF